MKNRASLFFLVLLSAISQAQTSVRERISFNADWRFEMDDPAGYSTSLVYDDLKPWILPSGNDFISNPAERYIRPAGNPGNDCPYVQSGFDDASWEQVTLPHDWAIAGPFMEGWGAEVGGSMGRLPSPGIGW